MAKFDLHSIPNPEKLKPTEPHEAQTLYNGMLLEPTAITIDVQGLKQVALCHGCRKSLESNIMKPPPFSLANGLWIGPRPIELARLTLPEALLVAQVYPRVFICKLWPKDRRGVHADNVQSGLLGNVTSFEMNTDAIKNMTEGNLMPRRPEVLASLISITIVSKIPLPRSWLKGTFRVRRGAIRTALIWLKTNNPTYYGSIEIDERLLSLLPVDDIPEELVNTIRRETMERCIESENDTYVPTDPVEANRDNVLVNGNVPVVRPKAA
jgi:hypothetical protein